MDQYQYFNENPGSSIWNEKGKHYFKCIIIIIINNYNNIDQCIISIRGMFKIYCQFKMAFFSFKKKRCHTETYTAKYHIMHIDDNWTPRQEDI